jgi:hypothetical protein
MAAVSASLDIEPKARAGAGSAPANASAVGPDKNARRVIVRVRESMACLREVPAVVAEKMNTETPEFAIITITLNLWITPQKRAILKQEWIAKCLCLAEDRRS